MIVRIFKHWCLTKDCFGVPHRSLWQEIEGGCTSEISWSAIDVSLATLTRHSCRCEKLATALLPTYIYSTVHFAEWCMRSQLGRLYFIRQHKAGRDAFVSTNGPHTSCAKRVQFCGPPSKTQRKLDLNSVHQTFNFMLFNWVRLFSNVAFSHCSGPSNAPDVFRPIVSALHGAVARQRSILDVSPTLENDSRRVLLHSGQLRQGQDHDPSLPTKTDTEGTDIWDHTSWLVKFVKRSLL